MMNDENYSGDERTWRRMLSQQIQSVENTTKELSGKIYKLDLKMNALYAVIAVFAFFLSVFGKSIVEGFMKK